MEDAMDDIAEQLLLRWDTMAFRIDEGCFGADKSLPEHAGHVRRDAGRIDREGDAVCRGGVVKKFLMESADLRIGNEMENDLIGLDLEMLKKERDRLPHLGF